MDQALTAKQRVVIELTGKTDEELKIIREFLVQKCPDFKLKESLVLFNLFPIPTYSWSSKNKAKEREKEKKKNALREIRNEFENKGVKE
jgi:adenine C2-methylase RlmN of 23S rRNA A2503 and tRNA A37